MPNRYLQASPATPQSMYVPMPLEFMQARLMSDEANLQKALQKADETSALIKATQGGQRSENLIKAVKDKFDPMIDKMSKYDTQDVSGLTRQINAARNEYMADPNRQMAEQDLKKGDEELSHLKLNPKFNEMYVDWYDKRNKKLIQLKTAQEGQKYEGYGYTNPEDYKEWIDNTVKQIAPQITSSEGVPQPYTMSDGTKMIATNKSSYTLRDFKEKYPEEAGSLLLAFDEIEKELSNPNSKYGRSFQHDIGYKYNMPIVNGKYKLFENNDKIELGKDMSVSYNKLLGAEIEDLYRTQAQKYKISNTSQDASYQQKHIGGSGGDKNPFGLKKIPIENQSADSNVTLPKTINEWFNVNDKNLNPGEANDYKKDFLNAFSESQYKNNLTYKKSIDDLNAIYRELKGKENTNNPVTGLKTIKDIAILKNLINFEIKNNEGMSKDPGEYQVSSSEDIASKNKRMKFQVLKNRFDEKLERMKPQLENELNKFQGDYSYSAYMLDPSTEDGRTGMKNLTDLANKFANKLKIISEDGNPTLETLDKLGDLDIKVRSLAAPKGEDLIMNAVDKNGKVYVLKSNDSQLIEGVGDIAGDSYIKAAGRYHDFNLNSGTSGIYSKKTNKKIDELDFKYNKTTYNGESVEFLTTKDTDKSITYRDIYDALTLKYSETENPIYEQEFIKFKERQLKYGVDENSVAIFDGSKPEIININNILKRK